MRNFARKIENKTIMATMTLQVPAAQIGWFEQMVRTMGWSFHREDTPSVASVDDNQTITPAMRRRITKARKELEHGETIHCSSKAEMQKYFDSL